MIYLLNGENITGKQFWLNDITYPSNWCELATKKELQELNIISLEEIFPDLEEGHICNGKYTDDMKALTRTYHQIPFNV